MQTILLSIQNNSNFDDRDQYYFSYVGHSIRTVTKALAMYVQNFILLFLLFLTVGITAQTSPIKDHELDHHDHHRNEIGIANSPVYFVKEKELSYGLHIHFIHTLHESVWGLGVGYERIFDAHGHNTIGIIGSYRPIDPLSFILSPGITFEDANPGESAFALHAETAYEFEAGNFHLGPVLELAYDPEDFHISLGIHIGFGF